MSADRRPVPDIVVDHAALRAAVAAIFAALGSDAREQRLVSEHLVEANLRGHDSHGVGMIPAYVASRLAGELTLNARPAVLADGGGFILLDGQVGLGQAIAHDAMEIGIARAREAGTCVLALRNAHHIGRIGHWAEQCAAAGLVSIHFVNVASDPAVAPYGGFAGRVGTNPVCIGFPRPGAEPIIVDFATSRLAVGKIRVAHAKGVPVPEGVLIDSKGAPTTDPAVIVDEPKGAVLPFGEHKGWGLALACELLGGALTGGVVMAGPRTRVAIINSLFAVIVSPERLGTAEAFFGGMEDFALWAQSPPPGREPTVRIPGDPERATRARRVAAGIPVSTTTWQAIVQASLDAGCAPGAIEAIAAPRPAGE
jgi:uncharacterized oxidoreductase